MLRSILYRDRRSSAAYHGAFRSRHPSGFAPFATSTPVCGELPLGSGRQLVEASTVKLPPVISQIDKSSSWGSAPSRGRCHAATGGRALHCSNRGNDGACARDRPRARTGPGRAAHARTVPINPRIKRSMNGWESGTSGTDLISAESEDLPSNGEIQRAGRGRCLMRSPALLT